MPNKNKFLTCITCEKDHIRSDQFKRDHKNHESADCACETKQCVDRRSRSPLNNAERCHDYHKKQMEKGGNEFKTKRAK